MKNAAQKWIILATAGIEKGWIYFSTLRTEVGNSSDTLKPIYQITWSHVMDNSNLYCLFIYHRPFISKLCKLKCINDIL
jgi:hypothetical protein